MPISINHMRRLQNIGVWLVAYILLLAISNI